MTIHIFIIYILAMTVELSLASEEESLSALPSRNLSAASYERRVPVTRQEAEDCIPLSQILLKSLEELGKASKKGSTEAQFLLDSISKATKLIDLKK